MDGGAGDGLKASSSRDTAVRARASVRWLHSCLPAKHPGVMTQTIKQSRKAATQFQFSCADDRILACCLLFMEVDKQVTLVTNEVNLANKGMINGMQCGDSEDIVRVINGVEEGGVAGERQRQGPDEGKICSELIMQGENTTRDLLETVLRKEFLLAYGDKL